MFSPQGMYTGEFTEDEFRSLGIMATYVVDEVFLQLVRRFFVESLEFLREFCYNSSKRDIVTQILQEPGTFGYCSTLLNNHPTLQHTPHLTFRYNSSVSSHQMKNEPFCVLLAPFRTGPLRHSIKWTDSYSSFPKRCCSRFPRYVSCSTFPSVFNTSISIIYSTLVPLQLI